MILTKEFDLKPFVQSNTAQRLKIVNTPSPEIAANLRTLFDKLLRPLMDLLPGQFNVTSGYRCDKLNAAVRGKPGSQHTKGQAADIEYLEGEKENNRLLYDTVQSSGLEYDQCIGESPLPNGNFAWVHLSYNKQHNRKQAFILKP